MSLATLPAVGLEELVERAALLTRVDRKYAVTASRVPALLAGLAGALALEIDGARHFAYASTYWDDEALTSFHLAAHARRRRYKVRHRTYASGLRFVEVKTRGARGTTVKQRLEVTTPSLSGEAGEFVEHVLRRAGFDVRSSALRPAMSTTYRRATLLLPRSGARVTVDTDLTWLVPSGASLRLPDLAIVETKSSSAASEADRHLWSQGVRPCRLSKYGTGMAALEPSVHGNRWRPVVRRHFTPTSPDRNPS